MMNFFVFLHCFNARPSPPQHISPIHRKLIRQFITKSSDMNIRILMQRPRLWIGLFFCEANMPAHTSFMSKNRCWRRLCDVRALQWFFFCCWLILEGRRISCFHFFPLPHTTNEIMVRKGREIENWSENTLDLKSNSKCWFCRWRLDGSRKHKNSNFLQKLDFPVIDEHSTLAARLMFWCQNCANRKRNFQSLYNENESHERWQVAVDVYRDEI